MSRKSESLARAETVSLMLMVLLPECGHPVTGSEADHLVARMNGFSDWEEMLMNIGRRLPDLFDPFLWPVDDARRMRHVAALVEFGLEPNAAEWVFGEIARPGRDVAPPRL